MISRLLSFSIRAHWLIVLLTVVVAAYGCHELTRLPLDALPDITNKQVMINYAAPSLGPEDVEKRITFPIANESGRVIAFTARTLETGDKAGPKYLNSPETALYTKSLVLFNLDKAKTAIRQAEFALLVEGQMDCISVYLREAHIRFAQRILDPGILCVLLLSTGMNVAVFGQALYLRAHKQEKFLFNSVVGAILVSSSTYFLGRPYGAAGMVLGYFAIALFFGLPSALFVFTKYRRAWHAA